MDQEIRDPNLRSGLSVVLIIFTVFIAVVVLYPAAFKYAPNFSPPISNCITSQQLVTMGKALESKEAEEILKRIKSDLKTNQEVLILEGSYRNMAGFPAASFPEFAVDGYTILRYYILVDSDFYNSLTGDEKRATIAHEMGHIGNIDIFIRMEIDSDNLASKYTSPQTVMDLLNKAVPNKTVRAISKEQRLRMENLERLKQGQ